MIQGIHPEGDKISYKLIRGKQKKTISIYVDKTGVTVRAPRRISEKDILAFVGKKARWILGKQEQIKQAMQLYPPKVFVSGEMFPYLGKQHRLKIVSSEKTSKTKCRFINGRLEVEINPALDSNLIAAAIRRAVFHWYLMRAELKIRERLPLYADRLGTWPTAVVIKNQKSRWGSCSYTGVVRLNWKIIMAPLSVLDYIIVHELCHLKHPNHSAAFWNEVESLIPDYRNKKAWFKEHQMIMHLFDNTITTS